MTTRRPKPPLRSCRRQAFHPRAVLRGTGRRTLADLTGPSFIEAAGGKRGEPARFDGRTKRNKLKQFVRRRG